MRDLSKAHGPSNQPGQSLDHQVATIAFQMAAPLARSTLHPDSNLPPRLQRKLGCWLILVAYVFRHVTACPICQHLSKMEKKCCTFGYEMSTKIHRMSRRQKLSCIMSATYVGSTGDIIAPSPLDISIVGCNTQPNQ